MNKEIKKKGKDWLLRLKGIAKQGGCVGEIVLSEEEVLKLSDILISQLKKAPYFEDAMTAALSVVVVNLAYYHYEGSGGHSFLKYLIPNYDVDQSKIELIGPKIETFLLNINMIPKAQYGPYRYVGLFIRQAGVTKQYLPQLKFYLKRFDQLIGLEKVADISYEDYRYRLEFILKRLPYSSGIFLELLRKPEGFHLIKTVAVLLDQLRTNEINLKELKSRPGFRANFWDDLIELAEPPSELSSPPVQRYDIPFFVYNPDYNKVGLSFDRFGVSQRAFHIEVTDHPLPIENTLHLFSDEDELEGVYKITINNRDEFEIRAWEPRVETEVTFQALFRISDGRMICSLNHPKALLASGEYYLITSGEVSDSLCEQLKLSHQNYLDLEGNQFYDVWHIPLSQEMRLEGLGECSATQGKIGLEWENPSHAPGTNSSLGIFSGRIPRCRIHGWNNIKYRFRLVCENEETRSKHIVSEDELIYQNGDAFYSASPPFYQKGSLKLELLGYTTVIPEITKLHFLLLPANFRIRWSYDLLSKDEQPQVDVFSKKELDVEWDKEYETKAQNNQTIYTFLPSTEFVAGYSNSVPGLWFNLNFKIAQAYLLNPTSPSTRNTLWHSSLDDLFVFIIRGHWDTQLELGLDYRDEIHPVWRSTEENKYKARIFSRDIKDGLAGINAVSARFVVKYQNSWKETHAVYLNENQIINTLQLGDDSFFNHIPEEIQFLFEDALECINLKDHEYTADLDSEIPEKLENFFLFLEVGKSLFDFDKSIDLDIERYTSTLYRPWLKWYNDYLKESSGPIESYQNRPIAEDLPLVPRWQEKINQCIKGIELYFDVPRLISDWEDEIKDPYGAQNSDIANMENGFELTRAANYYLKKRFLDALNQSQSIINSNPPKPIYVLALIINNLVKIRFWRFNEEIEPGSQSMDPWDIFLDHFNLFIKLFHSSSPAPIMEQPNLFDNLVSYLSILSEIDFGRLIENISNKEWEYIKEMYKEDPYVPYLIYKNNHLRENIEISFDQVRAEVISLQKQGKIPPHIIINH